MRAVLDTNVLIDGASDDYSVAAKLLDAVRDRKIDAVATAPTVREYQLISQRLINNADYRSRVHEFINALEVVRPATVAVQIDDDEDIKFVQAAIGGEADVLVTSDRHLLQLGEIRDVRMVTPQEAWVIFQEENEDSTEWQSWASGLGIGR